MLKTLKVEEKADWPSHLPALVFAYKATPHASTGYQPYQLMFGRHTPAPCDNWLELRAYNDDKLITHIDWVNQQLEQLLHANKCAQKNIKATNFWGITRIHRSPSRPRPSMRLTAAFINIHEHLI